MNSNYLENYKNVIRGDSIIPESLLSFSQEIIAKNNPQSVIELGSDRGQLLSQLAAPSKVGLEISSSAVDEANQINQNFRSYSHNVLTPWTIKADLLIDSHLFHCLVFKEERELYLKNLKQSLNAGGRILIECMGEPLDKDKIHFLFNEASQLWGETNKTNISGSISMNGRSFLPFRSWFNQDTEKEIFNSGLKIQSLLYSSLEFEFTIMDETIQAPLVRLVLGHS
jgi:SAM-dependent methyltransferase